VRDDRVHFVAFVAKADAALMGIAAIAAVSVTDIEDRDLSGKGRETGKSAEHGHDETRLEQVSVHGRGAGGVCFGAGGGAAVAGTATSPIGRLRRNLRANQRCLPAEAPAGDATSAIQGT